MNTETLSYFIGENTPWQFVALFFFAAIGATIKLLQQANVRDPKAPSTPEDFTWAFLLKDNWKRILLTVLLIYVGIVFKSLIPEDWTSWIPQPAQMAIGLVIGYGTDALSELLKNKLSFFQVKRTGE